MLRIFIENRCVKIPWSGCWIWEKATINTGYGCFRRKGKTYLAHREAYEQVNGPTKLHVLHTCDVPSCCNPEHLFAGTNLDNIRDSMKKGRRKGVTRNRPKGLVYKYKVKPGPRFKLTIEQCNEIRQRYAIEHISQRALAAEYDVSCAHICRILNHKV